MSLPLPLQLLVLFVSLSLLRVDAFVDTKLATTTLAFHTTNTSKRYRNGKSSHSLQLTLTTYRPVLVQGVSSSSSSSPLLLNPKTSIGDDDNYSTVNDDNDNIKSDSSYINNHNNCSPIKPR
jgi:hypothetical protein